MSNKFVNDNGKLKYAIFYIFYLNGYSNNKFSSFENNYAQVSLDKEWTNINKTKFFCLQSGKDTVPYATFQSISDHIDFLIDRNKSRMENVKTDNLPSELAKFYLKNVYPNVPSSVYDSSDVTFYTQKADESIKLFDKTKKGVNI
jgi:lipopolysaccharide export LptBFGC system permease protein LptF